MPSFPEVKFYISGLWLLFKGDPQGLKRLDLTDRGMMRSFWAFVWCLPAMFVYWTGVRYAFLSASAPGTKAGVAFYLRLFMVEAINWVLPLVLLGILCLLLKTERKFTAIVVATNWLSVPISYAYAVLTLLLFLAPFAAGFIALVQLALLIATIFAISRFVRQICGQEPLVVATTLLVLLVPGLIIADLLQSYLGVSPY
ncbi:hypothetical protein [Aliirhizobium smilacinae]|uniref:Yip1 domain-containing protein n=1 Tax=Aliirhizobium smilacinae TaxID=1395944 RepID=A0A5C4XSG1_9HYPH|nr:hypothetical protein [Rhizobium smilacinae]TNM66278.1 hypothetical protein FHP24_08775 [Rhizobium smilacinae]